MKAVASEGIFFWLRRELVVVEGLWSCEVFFWGRELQMARMAR